VAGSLTQSLHAPDNATLDSYDYDRQYICISRINRHEMADPLLGELREQGRGFVGALLAVGMTFLYTMESWQLGKTLSMSHLLIYAILGVGGIVVLTHAVGFRQEDRIVSSDSPTGFALVVESAEILFQSLLAAYVGLFLLGIININDSIDTVVRLGLIEVVPLGFGAALANQFVMDDEGDDYEDYLPRNIAVFTIGALFIASTIAPTQEIEVIAAQTGWIRTLTIALLSVFLTYFTLFELEFRGQQGRIDRSRSAQMGTALTAYAVGVIVSIGLLAAYGHFIGTNFSVMVQKTILLSFPASLGASGAEVIL
jgi:putative integral membrane protein (TIGR02587 family)